MPNLARRTSKRWTVKCKFSDPVANPDVSFQINEMTDLQDLVENLADWGLLDRIVIFYNK